MNYSSKMLHELAELYQNLQRELDQINPVCNMSGDCCHFDRVDHLLYATPLEIAYLQQYHKLPAIMPAENVCPFLIDEKCSAREHRMLACRIYYCDPTYQDTSQDLFEKYLNQIKAIYQKHNHNYSFLPVLQTWQQQK